MFCRQRIFSDIMDRLVQKIFRWQKGGKYHRSKEDEKIFSQKPYYYVALLGSQRYNTEYLYLVLEWKFALSELGKIYIK